MHESATVWVEETKGGGQACRMYNHLDVAQVYVAHVHGGLLGADAACVGTQRRVCGVGTWCGEEHH